MLKNHSDKLYISRKWAILNLKFKKNSIVQLNIKIFFQFPGYRKLIKNWLTEKGSVEKILVGVFGNKTKPASTNNVGRATTVST